MSVSFAITRRVSVGTAGTGCEAGRVAAFPAAVAVVGFGSATTGVAATGWAEGWATTAGAGGVEAFSDVAASWLTAVVSA